MQTKSVDSGCHYVELKMGIRQDECCNLLMLTSTDYDPSLIKLMYGFFDRIGHRVSFLSLRHRLHRNWGIQVSVSVICSTWYIVVHYISVGLQALSLDPHFVICSRS